MQELGRQLGTALAPFFDRRRVAHMVFVETLDLEEEPRGHGIQRGIGTLISCPYCMGPWCAAALGFGFVFAPKVTRFFAGILVSVTISDFLHRAYAAAKEDS